MGSRWLAAMAVVTAWTVTSVAQLRGADKALATELFDQARALMAQGRYPEACPKLAESQRLDPGGGTLLNLAVCHEKQGLTATAWSEFHEALALAERDGVGERVKLAGERIDALKPRLSRLMIQVQGDARVVGLVVERDGSTIAPAAWGVSTPIDPGTHSIRASAAGFVEWVVTVTVGDDGDTQTVSVPKLERVPAPLPPRAPARTAAKPRAQPRPRPPAPAPPGTRGHSAYPYVFAGVGALAWSVAGYAAIRARQSDRESDASCTPGCTARGLELNDEAKRFADVASVGFGVGVVALGTAVYLWVKEPSSAKSGSVASAALRF